MNGWPRFANRIAPVVEPDRDQSAALAKAPTLPDGTVRNIFATFAHQPVLLKRFNAFVGTFMAFSTITSYDREVIVLRVAAWMQCRYELGQHLPLARDAGIADETIRALLDTASVRGLTGNDLLLARLADAVVRDGAVDDVLWSRITERYSSAQLVELLTLSGTYRMVANVLNIVGVELEADLDEEVDRWT